MSWYHFASRPYVSVARKRLQAERTLAKMKKRGQPVAPVRITGRTIATSFWGRAWCTNLERYSDYENRLPRGRSYLRNGSVVDLQIARGKIAAMVVGSRLYRIKLAIKPVEPVRWKAICRDCSGTVDSLIELLQGRLQKSAMERVCREHEGLFPSPEEIELACSCPDWAGMCKHVAAVLYGVGARLDENPQLLFVLRGVNESELIAAAGQDLPYTSAAPDSAKVLDNADVAALFGLDMVETTRLAAVTPSDDSQAAKGRKQARGPKPIKARRPAVHRPQARKAGSVKKKQPPRRGRKIRS